MSQSLGPHLYNTNAEIRKIIRSLQLPLFFASLSWSLELPQGVSFDAKSRIIARRYIPDRSILFGVIWLVEHLDFNLHYTLIDGIEEPTETLHGVPRWVIV